MDMFWKRVERNTEEHCWPFIGRILHGYGEFHYRRRAYKAHRVAYALTYPGSIPWGTGMSGSKGTLVLHRCDNKACCNPAHLFLGTQQDNVRDAVRKGRMQHGERHFLAKLTIAEVREIKELQHRGQLYRPGRGWHRRTPRPPGLISPDELAARYGVHSMAISQVLTGRAWAHVAI